MNQTVEKGKTLIVDGPASVCLVSGKAETFGYTPAEGAKLIIREGKRIPFHVTENATFSIHLGAGAGVEEPSLDTIPPSWLEAFEIICAMPKPAVVMVIGGTDSGKSSLCTFLANKLLTQKSKVAILDCDLGQSDIGPPGTVAYAVPARPFTDLFNLQSRNAFFVGETSPSRAVSLTLTGIAYMKTEAQGCHMDYLIANTDGWVSDDEAIIYKAQVAELLKPSVVFCMERIGELPSLCAQFGDALGDYRQETAEAPTTVKTRNREKRRSLRELGYNKYLADAKLRAYTLSRLRLETTDVTKPFQESKGAETAQTAVERKKALSSLIAAKGQLLGLADARGKFLGIGVSQGIDADKKTLKVFTTVPVDPALIQVGKVLLDRDLHEITL